MRYWQAVCSPDRWGASLVAFREIHRTVRDCVQKVISDMWRDWSGKIVVGDLGQDGVSILFP